MDKYVELKRVLNELDLGVDAKVDIVNTFNRNGIRLDICSTCLRFIVSGLSDGCESYCDYVCLTANDDDVNVSDVYIF